MKDSERGKYGKKKRFRLNRETLVFEQEVYTRRDQVKREGNRSLRPKFNPNYLDLGEGLGHAGTFEIYTKEGQLAGYLDIIPINDTSIQGQRPAILAYMSVYFPFRNQHYGSSLVNAFNELLEKIGAFGVLQNAIPETDPAHDIYKKAHWEQVDDTNIFTYNLYCSASPKQLKRILNSEAALVYTQKTLLSSMTRFR